MKYWNSRTCHTTLTRGFQVVPTVDLVMGIQQLLRSAGQGATHWYVEIDQVSRRNAMVGCTALAQRRLEYLEVEKFLTLHQRRHDARRGVAMQRTG